MDSIIRDRNVHLDQPVIYTDTYISGARINIGRDFAELTSRSCLRSKNNFSPSPSPLSNEGAQATLAD